MVAGATPLSLLPRLRLLDGAPVGMGARARRLPPLYHGEFIPSFLLSALHLIGVSYVVYVLVGKRPVLFGLDTHMHLGYCLLSQRGAVHL